jgi:hypothetical protein
VLTFLGWQFRSIIFGFWQYFWVRQAKKTDAFNSGIPPTRAGLRVWRMHIKLKIRIFNILPPHFSDKEKFSQQYV